MLEGHTLFYRMPRGTPMISTGRVGVVPLRERRLVNPFGGHHRHLVGNQRWELIRVRHQNRGELRNLLPWRVPPRIGTRARIGNVDRASLCRSRALSGGPFWLSGYPLLDGHRVGRVSGAGRKAWLMLGILVGVVRGLLGFQPSKSQSHGVGIPFLLLCPTCSESSVGCTGRGDVTRFLQLTFVLNSYIKLASFLQFMVPFVGIVHIFMFIMILYSSYSHFVNLCSNHFSFRPKEEKVQVANVSLSEAYALRSDIR